MQFLRMINVFRSSKVFKNFVVNGVNFLVKILMGFVVPPMIIQRLGIAELGFVQMAIGVAAYTAIFANALNQANNRFVAIEYLNNNRRGTSLVLTTIFILYAATFFLFSIVLGYFSFNIESIFNIDTLRADKVSWLFLFVGLGQVFIMANSAISAPLYSKNRLDIIQGVSVLRNLLKIVFIFLFLWISEDLVSVGIAFFIPPVITLWILYLYFVKYVPYYKLNIHDYDFAKGRQIILLSFWSFLAFGGTLLFSQTDIFLVNHLLGSSRGGEYALLVQWNLLVVNIATVLSVVLAPGMFKSYAEGDFAGTRSLLIKSIRLQGVFLVIPIAIIFVYAEQVLLLWVGSSYVHLAPKLRIMIFLLGVIHSTRLFHTFCLVFNRIKVYGFLGLILGVFHIISSYVLLNNFGFGLTGIVLSNTVFFALYNLVALPVYIGSFYKGIVKSLWIEIIKVGGLNISVIAIFYLFKILVGVNASMSSALLSIVMGCLGSGFGIYMLFLSKTERKQILSPFMDKLK